MGLKLPRYGVYVGRLTFDPDTLSHADSNGRRVVTDDGGATWRYARRGDPSHNARYERNALEIDTTPTVLARLAVTHGEEEAHRIMRAEQPHHYETQVTDEHYDLVARDLTRPKRDADVDAVTVTSHTAAWRHA